MWSIGAFLELDDRSKIEDWLRHSEEMEKRLDLPVIPSDSDATMFDYMVDHNGGCSASGKLGGGGDNNREFKSVRLRLCGKSIWLVVGVVALVKREFDMHLKCL